MNKENGKKKGKDKEEFMLVSANCSYSCRDSVISEPTVQKVGKKL